MDSRSRRYFKSTDPPSYHEVTKMDAAPSSADTSGNPRSTRKPNAKAPFLGTPYVMDMQRPYEYPFPSPATESCPSLLLPYSHGHPSIGQNQQPLQLTHPFPSYTSNTSYTSTSSSGSMSTTTSSETSSTPPSASSLVHRTHIVDVHADPNGYAHHTHHHHHGSAQPYPPTTSVQPPVSFRPSTLLRRRISSHDTHNHHNSTAGLPPASPVSMVSSSVPVPPRLLGLTVTNGRWRKGRGTGSDGDGINVE
jgi:hypothetical protein